MRSHKIHHSSSIGATKRNAKGMRYSFRIQLSCLICYTPAALGLVLPRSGLQNQLSTRLHTHNQNNNNNDDERRDPHDSIQDDSRRVALQSILLATAAIPLSASAGKPEIDVSGELFSPKAEMLSGGSAMTRGIRLDNKRPVKLKAGQTVQTVYEARFVVYLSRFLLNFDPAARTWWAKQGLDDTWSDSQALGPDDAKCKLQQEKFAEFAESVEVGLSNYFVGPYGSYASVEAAKAGLIASEPATSARAPEVSFWKKKLVVPGMKNKQRKLKAIDEEVTKRQGILNLYALLKARYISKTAKRQLAILFSLISSPTLQPVVEIRSLVGEADNAAITRVELSKPPTVQNEADSRTSSRRGGGYSISTPPTIVVFAPPALGDVYCQAKLEPIMKATSRVLRITVLDGGEGYTVAPAVKVTQVGGSACEACAIIDRRGHIESILVLDPGYGYGQGKKGTALPPKVVIIDAPKKKQSPDFRPAKAVAELEYEIVGLNILNGGNGYVADEFPTIKISPPTEDPDWFVQEHTFQRSNLEDVRSQYSVKGEVKEMLLGDGTIIDKTFCGPEVTDGMIARVKRDPLELLPSRIRPQCVDTSSSSSSSSSLAGVSYYRIPSLPDMTVAAVPSLRYRAFDPIFGPIGRVPVTKGARALSPSEYTRLALSGAVCTVIVRTALNPLELVKTKIQLGNDLEVNEFALSQMKEMSLDEGPSTTSDAVATETSSKDGKNETVGTGDMIKSLVKLRGFKSLFQSADITFLASLVFGSLGFGATELFRRSFTGALFPQGGGERGEEIVLLTAAAFACVLTSAVATPFEVLRVKSMGMVEAKGWTAVLDDFLEEKNGSARADAKLKPQDLLPLWSGFAPTVSRELPFAVIKFLVFDILAKQLTILANAQLGEGAIPVQSGVGTTGLAISAIAGAVAGVAGAIISHPADLILTLTTSKSSEEVDWKDVVSELLSREGGISNLFIGLPARSIFFFLVIGLQFFLYDYVKNIFEVGSDDLSLVLDVFYAVRQGFLDMGPSTS